MDRQVLEVCLQMVSEVADYVAAHVNCNCQLKVFRDISCGVAATQRARAPFASSGLHAALKPVKVGKMLGGVAAEGKRRIARFAKERRLEAAERKSKIAFIRRLGLSPTPIVSATNRP